MSSSQRNQPMSRPEGYADGGGEDKAGCKALETPRQMLGQSRTGKWLPEQIEGAQRDLQRRR